MTHLWTNAVDIVCWVLLVPILVYLAFRWYGRSDDRRALVIKWIVTVPLVVSIKLLTHVASPYTPIYILFPAVILALL